MANTIFDKVPIKPQTAQQSHVCQQDVVEQPMHFDLLWDMTTLVE